MPVTDEQVATLRAQLAGDHQSHRGQLDQLDRAAAASGYTALIAAGFFEAVYRRFAGKATLADVIEFVGGVRATTERAPSEIDPTVAERMILAALGEGPNEELDNRTRVGTQMILLAVLVTDEQLDDAGLDQFLAEARKTADEWLRKAE